MVVPQSDEFYMRIALMEARRAAVLGEVPIGGVAVFENGQIAAAAGNRVECEKSVTAHAELQLLRIVEKQLGDWRMDRITFFVTKEPCAMCAGALVNARAARIVFGLPDPRSGGCGSALDVTGFSGMLWQVPVTGGVLAEESGELLREFFRQIRRRN